MTKVDPKFQSVFGHIENNREAFIVRVIDYVRHP